MGSALRLPVMSQIADKLKRARLATGMSTRAVAARVSKRFGISHATIANYEKGRSVPPVTILAALADVYERPLNWFLENGRSLADVRYRNVKSKVRVKDRHRFEGEAQRWLEAYTRIEQRLRTSLSPRWKRPTLKRNETPTEFAIRVRGVIGLEPSAALPSVIEVLEGFGIRVMEMESEFSIDGMAARFGDEDIVILNAHVPNDRCRLNAAHELGHILLEGRVAKEGTDHRTLEKRAFEFASHLVLPNGRLKEAFDGQSMVKLVKFKERFGISLAAMVYRAEKAQFISKDLARRLWIEFSARGWRASEPGYVRPDRATRFEQLLDGAIMSETLTLEQAASVAQVREEEIRGRLQMAIGVDRYGIRENPDERNVLAFPQKT